MEANLSVEPSSALSDADFKRSLADVTPNLRAYAERWQEIGIGRTTWFKTPS